MFTRDTGNISRWVSGKLLLIVFLFVASVGIGSSAKYALAGTESALGWLWGGAEMLDVNGVTPPNNGVMDGDENGLGWVSMNNRDCDTNDDGIVDASEHTTNPACPAGGTARYGVDIPMADGDLSGYAWSGSESGGEQYGWISFNAGDVAGCPSGGICKARRVGNTILGWARVLAIRDAGLNAGGWGGWISLNDANFGGSNYGVTVDTSNNKLPGYAYSDELGWINFSIVGGGVSISPVASLKICPNPCNFNVLPFQKPSTFSSVPTTLYACYGPGSDCSTGSLVNGTWTEANPTPDAISLSTVPTTPATSTTVSKTYAGTTSADEDITLSYTPPASSLLSVTATAHVSCVALTCSNFTAQTNTYCPRDPQRSFNNSCSGTVSCPGTKVCNYDWTEGTP